MAHVRTGVDVVPPSSYSLAALVSHRGVARIAGSLSFPSKLDMDVVDDAEPLPVVPDSVARDMVVDHHGLCYLVKRANQ